MLTTPSNAPPSVCVHLSTCLVTSTPLPSLFPEQEDGSGVPSASNFVQAELEEGIAGFEPPGGNSTMIFSVADLLHLSSQGRGFGCLLRTCPLRKVSNAASFASLSFRLYVGRNSLFLGQNRSKSAKASKIEMVNP